MVAVTRKGLLRDYRRKGTSPTSPGTATIALPGPFRLEDCDTVDKKGTRVVGDKGWDYLLSTGWKVSEVFFCAARRLVESADGLDLYEVEFFSRDAVLERRVRHGSREYVDVVRVRIPWSDRVVDDGWEWRDEVDV